MFKRWSALLISAFLVAGLFSGCSGSSAGSSSTANQASQATSQKQNLTWWTLQQADINIQTAQQNAVKSFESANNCTIQVTSFPYAELSTKLLTAVAGGQGPDLLLMDQIWVSQYAAAKFVTPIDDMLPNSTIKQDDYFPGAWGAGSYLGKMYGVPFDVGVWGMLYYNKAMFKDAGLNPDSPPTTWDQFIADGKKLTKGGKYGTAVWGGKTSDALQCMLDAFTFSAGGKIVDDSGKQALLNSDAGVKAETFWKDCAAISPPGVTGRDEEASFKLFTAGEVGMFFYGEWGQDTIKTEAPNMDYGVANLPIPQGGQSIGTFGGFNLGINVNCKNKDLAWKFVEYATGQQEEMTDTMLTPANKAAAQAYLNSKRKFPDVIYKQLTSASYRPLVPNYTAIATVQANATQEILLGQMTAKQALDQAAAQINTLLNK